MIRVTLSVLTTRRTEKYTPGQFTAYIRRMNSQSFFRFCVKECFLFFSTPYRSAHHAQLLTSRSYPGQPYSESYFFAIQPRSFPSYLDAEGRKIDNLHLCFSRSREQRLRKYITCGGTHRQKCGMYPAGHNSRHWPHGAPWRTTFPDE